MRHSICELTYGLAGEQHAMCELALDGPSQSYMTDRKTCHASLSESLDTFLQLYSMSMSGNTILHFDTSVLDQTNTSTTLLPSKCDTINPSPCPLHQTKYADANSSGWQTNFH
jgi:hypothetical protein